MELNLAWTRLPHEALRTVCVEVSTKIRRLNLAGCREENTINDEGTVAPLKSVPPPRLFSLPLPFPK